MKGKCNEGLLLIKANSANGNKSWNTGNKIESHLGGTRLNTMQTLIMLCSKDKNAAFKRNELQRKGGRAVLLALSSF